MADLITLGLFATGLPVFIGILMAFSLIAIILGFFFWNAGSVPDDIGLAFIGSGLVMGLILFACAFYIRLALS